MLAPEARERPQLDALTFYLQPVLDLADGRVNGLEALVRWPRPDGTVRGPADFLCALMNGEDLDAFTRSGIAHVASLLAFRPHAPPIHLNLSPKQLALPATERRLAALRPEVRARLRIELTEQRIPDLSSYAASVARLARLGIPVLLDDLRPYDLPTRFPPRLEAAGVKLDRSVVEELLLAPWGASGRAVRRLAERGIELTAEGIEDPAAVPYLRDLGIRQGQGFALGRPQPDVDAVLAWQESHRPLGVRTSSAGANTGPSH